MGMNNRLLRPRASGFDPLKVSGLEAWWDASDSTTITLNSGNVSQWSDKSGKGNHLVQVNAIAQPAYSTSTNTINSRNTITFSSGVHRLILSTFNVSLPTILCVWRMRSGYALGASNAPVIFDTYNNTSDRHAHGFIENSSSNLGYARSSSAAANRASTTSASFGTTYISTCEALATGHNIWLNGVAGTSATAGTNGLLGISVGNLRGNPSPVAPNYNFDGQICEILVFSSSLTTSQRKSAEKWLALRWGVTL